MNIYIYMYTFVWKCIIICVYINTYMYVNMTYILYTYDEVLK